MTGKHSVSCHRTPPCRSRPAVPELFVASATPNHRYIRRHASLPRRGCSRTAKSLRNRRPFLRRYSAPRLRSPDAATASAEVANRTLSEVERPWVVVTSFGHEWRETSPGGSPTPNAWFLSTRWKNVGRMPAIVDELVIKIQDMDTLPPTPDYSGVPPMGIERVIAPDTETTDTQPMGPGLGSGIKDGKPIRFVVFGRLTYKELNGRVHHTGFAVQVNPHFIGTNGYGNPAYEYWD